MMNFTTRTLQSANWPRLAKLSLAHAGLADQEEALEYFLRAKRQKFKAKNRIQEEKINEYIIQDQDNIPIIALAGKVKITARGRTKVKKALTEPR